MILFSLVNKTGEIKTCREILDEIFWTLVTKDAFFTGCCNPPEIMQCSRNSVRWGYGMIWRSMAINSPLKLVHRRHTFQFRWCAHIAVGTGGHANLVRQTDKPWPLRRHGRTKSIQTGKQSGTRFIWKLAIEGSLAIKQSFYSNNNWGECVCQQKKWCKKTWQLMNGNHLAVGDTSLLPDLVLLGSREIMKFSLKTWIWAWRVELNFQPRKRNLHLLWQKWQNSHL